MPDTADEIRRCQSVLRQASRAILAARVKLALLWIPAALGLSWARRLTLAQQDAISEWRYTAEEFAQNLYKLRKYGTTLALLVSPYPLFSEHDDGDGYHGWLAPEDRYQVGSGE
jgi:hypothetical protein